MKQKSQRIRFWVQIGFFVLIALIALSHTLEKAGIVLPLIGAASLHAVCPFGGVETIYTLATNGTFVQKIHESSVVLMWIVFALAFVFGPVFCGWVCPFGTIQELVGKLGKKLLGKHYNKLIPQKVDDVLRFARYGVLIYIIAATAVTGKLIFEGLDPYYALFSFWTGEVALPALILLGVTLVLSLFVERPFCKYACPYGAVLGIFNFFRIFQIRRNPKTCIDCKACDKNCPMNIEVSKMGAIRHHQCISCLKCSSESACPVVQTVELKLGKYPEGEKV